MIREVSWWVCLGLLAFATVVGAQAASPEVTRCDELMADEDDPKRVATAASPELITDPEFLKEAVRACEQALANEPDNPRLLFQFGLALAAKEKVHGEEITGLKYMIRAAEAGYLAAQVLLAKIYNFGVFGEVNDDKAFGWDRRAAENEDLEAQARVGIAIIAGAGTEKNVSEGVAYLERAAAEGNAFAHSALGTLLLEGKYVSKDKARAIQHLEIAVAAKESGAQLVLGSLLIMEGMMSLADGKSREIPFGYKEAIDEAGKTGTKLAEKLTTPDATQLDAESRETMLMGVELLKMAAEQGEAMAALNLIQYYGFEEVINLRDPEKAAQSRSQYAHWICKAGEIGRELAPELAAKCPD